jgi:hypothetical protein
VERERGKEKGGGVSGVDSVEREKGAREVPSLERTGEPVAVPWTLWHLRLWRAAVAAIYDAIAATFAVAVAGGRPTAYENLRSKEFLRRNRLSKVKGVGVKDP